MKGDLHDPKALIREAYNIEGITAPECRAIFFDWALSVPQAEDTAAHLRVLIDRHASAAPDHPMSAILQEGLEKAQPPRRRGGRTARVRD
jgi:hypothetical protein